MAWWNGFAYLVVERSKRVELLQTGDECFRWGRIHKVKVDEVVDAQRLEHQHHACQVGALDLRYSVLVQLVLEAPRGEQPEALRNGVMVQKKEKCMYLGVSMRLI